MQRAGAQNFLSIVLVPVIILAFGAAALVLVPATRNRLREVFFNNSRQVLAKVEADFTGQGDIFEIVKVMTAQAITLEIFKKDIESHESVYVSKIVLDEKRDGYFDFHGRAVNMAIEDVDQDGH